MAATFLGLTLAGTVDARRAVDASHGRTLSGKPIYDERPTQRISLLAAVVPDAFGRGNLAGRVEAHMRRHRTDRPFEEVCPQRLGTLAAAQAARTVRARTAAGSLSVPASGDVSGVEPGRIVSFGAGKRLYVVTAVDAGTNSLAIDIPLAADLARGAAIDWTPTGSWHWSPTAEPPTAFVGPLSGVGWLIDVVEAV